MGIPSVLFFAGCLATASAAITPSDKEPATVPRNVQSNKPTFAIFVLLVGVYSWILTLAIHIFDAFFKNGLGSTKYFVTLGIAISCTVFMQIYGKRIVREHLGVRGGRNLEISGRQAVYIAIFVVSIGIYAAWLMA
jgi:hypothetical protein